MFGFCGNGFSEDFLKVESRQGEKRFIREDLVRGKSVAFESTTILNFDSVMGTISYAKQLPMLNGTEKERNYLSRKTHKKMELIH